MRWETAEIDAAETAQKYGLSPLSAKVVAASDLSDEQIAQLKDPGAMMTSRDQCVREACERIMMAKDQGEKVFVGGDYDADGICATAIMKKTLDVLGIRNGYYIPDRLREGYGLSAHTVDLVHKKGYTLIITVDNGVKAEEALARAAAYGMDVIVTDHHIMEGRIQAQIVVHPALMDKRYASLCGAGTALQISRSLIGDDPQLNALAMAASIGDVMPLWDETRRIVLTGMKNLREGCCPALKALLRNPYSFDETDVAFQIVPKLNAISRMDENCSPNAVVKYLLCTSQGTIQRLADQINGVNERRKRISDAMSARAEQMVNRDDFLVLYDSSFKQGIAGLCAGRIAEKYHKPTLVLADHEDLLTGSCRGVEGFNVYDFFSDFTELEAFGGHPMAAGLSLKKENYASFQVHVKEKMAETGFVYKEPVQKAILIDADDISIDNIIGLHEIAPVPADMQAPVFAVENPVAIAKRNSPKVIKYHFASKEGGFDGLIFPRGQSMVTPMNVSRVIGRLAINRWQNHLTCQMLIDDIAGR